MRSILSMSLQISEKLLRKEIERKINELRRKYGMDFDEFFELVESNIGKLLDRGFNLGEVLEDSLMWENLLDELEQLRDKIRLY